MQFPLIKYQLTRAAAGKERNAEDMFVFFFFSFIYLF